MDWSRSLAVYCIVFTLIMHVCYLFNLYVIVARFFFETDEQRIERWARERKNRG